MPDYVRPITVAAIVLVGLGRVGAAQTPFSDAAAAFGT